MTYNVGFSQWLHRINSLPWTIIFNGKGITTTTFLTKISVFYDVEGNEISNCLKSTIVEQPVLVSPKLEVRFSILRLLSLMKLTFSVSDQIISGVTTVLTTPILNGASKMDKSFSYKEWGEPGLGGAKDHWNFSSFPFQKI